MFKSILRSLSCSVDKQFLLRLDLKFLESLGTYQFHLKSFYFYHCVQIQEKGIYIFEILISGNET